MNNILFGRYRTLKADSMESIGSVCQGFDIITERPVVITMVHKERLTKRAGANALNQLRLDIRTALKIAHPDIVQTFESSEDETYLYIIHEEMNWPTIALITKRQAVRFADLLSVIERIVFVVEYYHHNEIYECGVSLSTIFLAPDFDIKTNSIALSRLTRIIEGAGDGAQAADTRTGTDLDTFLVRQNAALKGDLEALGGVIGSLANYYRNRKGNLARPAVSVLPPAERPPARPGDPTDVCLPMLDKIAERARDTGAQGFKSVGELSAAVAAVVERFQALRNPEEAARKAGQSRLSRRIVNAGTVIFREGDFPNERGYIIEEGRVQLLKQGEGGQEIFLDTSGPGDIIGEMALIDDQPRMATARALERCVLMVITREKFQARLKGLDMVSQKLIHTLVRRLRFQASEVARLKALVRVVR